MDQINIPLERLLGASEGSIYKLVILAAKRAIGLTDGEKPLVKKLAGKVLDTALKEIDDGKIRVKSKK